MVFQELIENIKRFICLAMDKKRHDVEIRHRELLHIIVHWTDIIPCT